MSIERWKNLVGEDELTAYERAGFGGKLALGRSPAILNIDMTYMFVDPGYALTFGDTSGVMKAVTALTYAAREIKVPFFYVRRDARNHLYSRGIWAQKVGASQSKEYTTDKRADQWPPEIAPRSEDVIIYKNKHSAFFGTPLASMLAYAGINTLIVVGVNTSGCIRATVQDAFSYNYPTIVPEECVWDRCKFAHEANLFDMDMRLADVLKLDEVINYLRTLRSADP